VNKRDFHENFDKELQNVNEKRLKMLENLLEFQPPQSNKSYVYTWFDSFKKLTQQIEELNSSYIKELMHLNQQSNSDIIKKIESTLEFLVNSHIIDKENSTDIFEYKLLPIWNKKQKQIEEFIENLEV
jgi:hypothetical protein